jgi:RNA polymerase sigma factor (sigma-70 family)
MEDRELIERFVQGDKACFDELVKRYQKLVFNVCAKMLFNYEETLDVAQDIFLKLYESLKNFRHEAKFSTYLYTITLNSCRNRLRALNRQRKHQAFSLDDPIDSDDGPMQRELASASPTPRQNLDEKEKNEMQRDLAEKQKDEISAQKKALTDSIRYASRIQSALQPESKSLSKIFSDYFILNKPKDIVSGDFYWISTKEDKTVVAVADSTGHGVPGAFMSLLGIEFLEEIVENLGITQPDKILDNLRSQSKYKYATND